MTRAEHDRQAAEAMATGLAALARGADAVAKAFASGLGALAERARTMAAEMERQQVCPAHGAHPHNDMICLDCPRCATRDV